jgi:glycosyltransferase involved in cell wall biosynthesis
LPSIGIVMHDFALGGTERIATRLAARWSAEGAPVRIFCGTGEGDMRALLSDQVEVVEASPPISRGFGSRTALGRAAARHFGERPVDVVFLPGNFHWPIVPALAALPRDRRPAIAAQVSATLSKPQRRPIQQMLFEWRMRHLLRDAQAVITLSAAATNEAERILRRSMVCTIPLPALGDDRVPPRPVPEDSRIILAVGRLVPEKGFDALIEAFAALPDPAAELVIVGEGPDRERLEGLIGRYGLAGRVQLPGFVSDTRGWLDKARLAAMPSRFEGYPAVLVEAFAAGRPAMATACTPAAAELIDAPIAGRVVEIDDCAGMTTALKAMLDGPIPDPARLAARVERHRIGPVARAYLALFQGLSVANRP